MSIVITLDPVTVDLYKLHYVGLDRTAVASFANGSWNLYDGKATSDSGTLRSLLDISASIVETDSQNKDDALRMAALKWALHLARHPPQD